MIVAHPQPIIPPPGAVKFPTSFGGTIFGRKKWVVEPAMTWMRQIMLDTLKEYGRVNAAIYFCRDGRVVLHERTTPPDEVRDAPVMIQVWLRTAFDAVGVAGMFNSFADGLEHAFLELLVNEPLQGGIPCFGWSAIIYRDSSGQPYNFSPVMPGGETVAAVLPIEIPKKPRAPDRAYARLCLDRLPEAERTWTVMRAAAIQ
jgi:hypothetical protein